MKRWLLTIALGCASAETPPPATDSAVSDQGTDTFVAPDSAAVDAAPSDTAPFDSGTTMDTSMDTSVDTSVDAASPDSTLDTADAAPLGPLDCLGDVGPSTGTLVDFLYQRQVGACTSSACSDFMMFGATCELTLQVADVQFKAILSAEHCAALRRWLTSDVLINHLRDTTTCYGAKGPTFESTQITRSDGSASKKTSMCKVEPFVSHRSCLDRLRAEYFPGK